MIATILVIQKDPAARARTCAALEAAGHRVRGASDAGDALDACVSGVPALVLLDAALPDPDGRDLVRRLRALPGGQGLPVLALAACACRGGEGDAGFSAVLEEPVDPVRLVRAVAWLLGRKGAAGRTLPPPAEPGPTPGAELAEAYERLAASERRYRELLDGATDAVFVLSPDGTIDQVNRAALRLLGRPRHEVVGSPFDPFSPPGVARDEARAQFARVTAGASLRADARVLRPSGEVREIEFSATLIDAAGGRSVLAIATDVTELRRAERCKAVEHAATRVLATAGSLAEAVPALLDELVTPLGWDAALYWSADGAGRLTVAHTSSGEAARLLTDGATPPGLGVHDAAMVSTASAGRGCGRCAVADHAGVAAVVAFPVVADGESIGVAELWRREPATHDQRLLDSLTVIGRQLGQFIRRRRSEDRLRASEERFRHLTESLPQVFWVTSANRTEVLYISPAYETVWGRPREELYADGSVWLESVLPADRERVLAASAASDERPFEYALRRPDGSVRTVRVQLRVVRDPRGRIMMRTGVAEDVTERRELEARYLQAQKMEAIGQLAGGVAHDFNNLLTVIMGQVDLVLRGMTDEDPARGELEPVLNAATKAASLTRQLLAFSRRQVLQPRALDLNACVHEMRAMLSRLIPEDIVLEPRCAPGPLRVLADPGQLEQVLLNLVVNARDAMPRGGRLTIETADSGAPDRPVTLVVHDTGAGIDPWILPRIFEPFFTTKEPGKGTGLGLATVMGIVQQSGGAIDVRSAPGAGSTFTIRLPRAAGPAIPHALEAAPRAAPAACAARTVLVVDDDADIARLAEAILRRRGYTVLRALDADDAVALARSHAGTIDLVLTDVVMPGASGPELVARVREVRAGVPALYMSGYLDDKLERHGLQLDEIRLVPKPFGADALVLAVERAITATTEGPCTSRPSPS